MRQPVLVEGDDLTIQYSGGRANDVSGLPSTAGTVRQAIPLARNEPRLPFLEKTHRPPAIPLGLE